MTLQSIRESLQLYDAASQTRKEAHTVILLFSNAGPMQPDDEVIDFLQEDIPPDILYHGDNVREPTTLYRILKHYIVLKGVTYELHPSVNRTTYGLLETFNCEEHEEEEARILLHSVKARI